MRVVRVIALTIVSLAVIRPLEAATLTWDANPEPDVRGYIVSYGTQSGVHPTSMDVGNNLTYVFSPPAGQRYFIVVQAYSGSGTSAKSDEVVLDLRTTTANQPPTLNQPGNQSGYVGNTATLTLSGSDPENAPLTYSATGLPPGLALNSSSGVISGTLQTAGNYNVNVTVSDGSLSASRLFAWVVATQSSPTPTPAPPPGDTSGPSVSFTSPTNNSTVNGKKVQVKTSASDPSGIRSVRYSLNGIVLSGEITVAPYQYAWDVSSLANGSYQLSAQALDNANNSSTTTITVNVSNGGNGKRGVSAGTAAEVDLVSDDTGGADASTDRENPDVPVRGDFDGDGLIDPGAFTKATGEWRLWLSSANYAPSAPLMWGAQDDVPVPADYDGDGRTDLAVFQKESGMWSIVLSNKGNPTRQNIVWGRNGDSPLPFDYDRDGRADLALQRPGGFDILLSSTNYTTSVTVR